MSDNEDEEQSHVSSSKPNSAKFPEIPPLNEISLKNHVLEINKENDKILSEEKENNVILKVTFW